jgi:predicted XRE-type DNA-binding protein
MARTGSDVANQQANEIIHGSDNVFADLGYADADERQTKVRLALAINNLVARGQLTQSAAAAKLRVGQPKISALANYKLDGFSVERLMRLLTALDQDVEIVIREKPASRDVGRISVIAA